MQEHYGELRMPVAILCDREDAIIDQEQQSLRLHRDIPGSRLYDLPESGHMLHHILPEQMVRTIRQLTESAEARSAPEPFTPYPAEVMS